MDSLWISISTIVCARLPIPSNTSNIARRSSRNVWTQNVPVASHRKNPTSPSRLSIPTWRRDCKKKPKPRQRLERLPVVSCPMIVSATCLAIPTIKSMKTMTTSSSATQVVLLRTSGKVASETIWIVTTMTTTTTMSLNLRWGIMRATRRQLAFVGWEMKTRVSKMRQMTTKSSIAIATAMMVSVVAKYEEKHTVRSSLRATRRMKSQKLYQRKQTSESSQGKRSCTKLRTWAMQIQRQFMQVLERRTPTIK
mmetsp:Transcript_41728/g.118151  ORF Transcript_41728/g.118151 Transcript_41728/m.118151 type:complete len:252 (+) Transcript_41728:100-855(+)